MEDTRKTVKEWAKILLPLSIRIKYIENTRKFAKSKIPSWSFMQKLNDKIPRDTFICSSFDWANTKEGLKYWVNIQKKLWNGDSL